jgi:type I restriction enzyme S subunit
MFERETEFQPTSLGHLPRSWKAAKLEDHAIVKGRIGWRGLKASEYAEHGPYLIANKHLLNHKVNWSDCDHITDFRYEESPEIQLAINDVIMSKDGTIGEAAFIDNLPDRATTNSTMMLIRVRSEDLSPRYLFYFLQSSYFRRFMKQKKSGTSIPHIFQRDMKNLMLPLPTVKEQFGIVEVLSYVDLAIQKTDEVVAKTERLKKGLMQQLLTKGIGHREFKDTEIGKIPEDWKIVSIYDIKSNIKGAIVSGPFGSNIGKRFFVKEGVPLIRGNNLTLGEQLFVDDGFVYITKEKAEELKSCEALPNDLIFTAAGTLGQVGLIPKNGRFSRYIISNKQLRARVDENRALPLFLYYWFTSSIIKRIFKQRKTGTSIPVINLGVLRRLPIPLPESIEEQRHICGILSAVDSKLVSERRQKAELEKTKQALMGLLLTGKVRVKVD